jgi:hypothetical protein
VTDAGPRCARNKGKLDDGPNAVSTTSPTGAAELIVTPHLPLAPPLHADPEALALRHVVHIYAALDRFLRVSRGNREGHAFSTLAAKGMKTLNLGWITSRGDKIGASAGESESGPATRGSCRIRVAWSRRQRLTTIENAWENIEAT